MNPLSALYAIGSDEYTIPTLPSNRFSLAACDFISCCLTRDMNTRYSANALLKHTFITQEK